jgi:hypothetical protein
VLAVVLVVLLPGTCAVCPDGTYPDTTLNTSVCLPCNPECLTCSLAASNCTSCASVRGYALLNGSTSCVLACPLDSPVMPVRKVVGSQDVCFPCSAPHCLNCTASDRCFLCLHTTLDPALNVTLDNALILSNGTCTSLCPQGYHKQVNASSGQAYCAVGSQAQAAVEPEGLTLQLPLDFPCSLLASGLVVVALLLTIYQRVCSHNCKAVLFPLLSAALAVPELAGMLLSASAYFLLRQRVFLLGPLSWDLFMYFYVLCPLCSLGCGLYVLYASSRVSWGDPVYAKWTRQASCLQKGLQYAANLATIFNFKMAHALWSGIRSLPLLEHPGKLYFLYRPSALGVLTALAFIIVSGLNIGYHPPLKLIYIDSIVVVATSAILSLLALKRSPGFFVHHLENSPDLPVNKRVTASDDYLIASGIFPKPQSDHFSSQLLKQDSRAEIVSGSLPEDPSLSSRFSASSRSSLLLNPFSKSSSVRLENLSLQCTLMEDRSEQSHSQAEWSSTDRAPSAVCEPASVSNYQDLIRSVRKAPNFRGAGEDSI